MTIKNFYERLYAEREAAFGVGNPDPFVERALEHKRGGRALDVGAGDGRHSIFLARAGFEVKAFDVAVAGIEKIKTTAAQEGLSINAEVRDLAFLEIEQPADLIVCTFVLHHLFRERALHLIETLKAATESEGVNVITAFTKDGDFYRAKPDTNQFYLDANELRNLYSGWEILEYEEKKGEARARGPQGKPLYNVSAKIIAKKK